MNTQITELKLDEIETVVGGVQMTQSMQPPKQPQPIKSSPFVTLLP